MHSNRIILFLGYVLFACLIGLLQIEGCTSDKEDNVNSATATLRPEWSTFIETYGPEGEILSGMVLDQLVDEGFILCGSLGYPNANISIVRTDASGYEEWNKTFESTSDDSANAVQRTNDDGFVLTGSRNREFYLMKTDATGTEEWTQYFEGTGQGEGLSVRQTNDGGYIVLGHY